MSDVMSLATRSRASAGTPVQFAPLREQYNDGTFTRVLAERVSDGAPHVLYVSGEHANIVSTHNERSQLTFEHKRALTIASDEQSDEPTRAAAATRAEQLSVKLDKLPRTKAALTLHVASALDHYSRTDTPK